MKKWLILLVAAAALLQFFADRLPQTGLLAWIQGSGPHQQLDEQGRPVVLVFTAENCDPCVKVLRQLDRRGASYQEYPLDDNKENQDLYKSYDGRGLVPLLVAGEHRLKSYDEMNTLSFLAELYGDSVLSRNEQLAMSNHFDEQGEPRLFMYATSWCGYCAAAREYFEQNNIDYEEINPEASSPGRLSYQTLKGAGFPLIYIGYRRYIGFPNSALMEELRHFEVGS